MSSLKYNIIDKIEGLLKEVYLLRGFPFLFIVFFLFFVFHELQFLFQILLPVRKKKSMR